jgi:hypothetical protein
MHKDSTAIILITVILTVLGIMVSYSVEGIEKSLQSFLVKQLILLFIVGAYLFACFSTIIIPFSNRRLYGFYR